MKPQLFLHILNINNVKACNTECTFSKLTLLFLLAIEVQPLLDTKPLSTMGSLKAAPISDQLDTLSTFLRIFAVFLQQGA
jgi:hypothetical protein